MSAFGKLQAFKFVTLLSKPFDKWDAFELGLIDEDGNIIKKPASNKEKKALDVFENLVRKIKRILLRYLPNKKLFSFLVAAYLLKVESTENNKIIYEINEELNEKEQKMLYSVLNDSPRILGE